MLQDIVNYIKKVVFDEFNISIIDNSPLPNDTKLDKVLYVITTDTIESMTDMCGNRYVSDKVLIKGATVKFNANNEGQLETNIIEIQTFLDKLANELISRTRRQGITLNSTTDITQFNNSFSILPIGLDPAGRHVYELVMVVQWQYINQ